MIPSIPRLLTALYRDRYLFEAMFEKRHRMVGRHEVLADIDEDKLSFLLDSELLINTDDMIELDDRLLQFFEDALDASGDVEIGDVDELLENLRHNISLYSGETHMGAKERYLMKIQRILKKIPNLILKNLNLLQLHIGLSYKTQRSHANKVKELEHYRSKLEKLISIEGKVEQALGSHDPFFKNVGSHETVMLTLRLKGRLRELRISLNALQREVIEYINKTLQTREFFEHVIKLKELKTSLEIKERTNIMPLVEAAVLPLSFEKAEKYSAHVEKEYIYEEDFDEIIEKLKLACDIPTLQVGSAAAIDESFFEAENSALSMVNIDALHDQFVTTDGELFSFVHGYDFESEKSFEQRIEIYCQMALMFEDLYSFSDEYATKEGYEYLKIYPKGAA